MRRQRPDRPMSEMQNKGGGMKTPQRRDISARQELLGKELRQLFDDYTQEDMPDELMKLAAQLQGAFQSTPPTAPQASEESRSSDPAADPANPDKR